MTWFAGLVVVEDPTSMGPSMEVTEKFENLKAHRR
jgi:hypothetical protein